MGPAPQNRLPLDDLALQAGDRAENFRLLFFRDLDLVESGHQVFHEAFQSSSVMPRPVCAVFMSCPV